MSYYAARSGVTYRIVSDRLGSPSLVANAQIGEIVQRMDYDEFGNITLDSNPGLHSFGFTDVLTVRS